MARLILLFGLVFPAGAHAFDTEVEIVFPYRDIKSGIVIGIDSKAEHMLYPVHTYGDKGRNQVGFFKKPKSELSKFIERSLPEIEKDLLDKKTPFIAPHSYAVKVNGQYLKPESKFFNDLIVKVENLAADGKWKGLKYDDYAYNKKTGTVTRESYDDGKLTGKTTKPLAALCEPQSSGVFFCSTGHGTLKISPQKGK